MLTETQKAIALAMYEHMAIGSDLLPEAIADALALVGEDRATFLSMVWGGE